MELAILLLITSVITAPIITQAISEEKHRRALAWLKHYNYYQGKHGELDEIPADALEEIIKEPLMQYQEFYGYSPANGVLNDDVIRLMEQPRCGDVDIPTDETKQRQKRWSRLSATIWNNMPVTISFANYTTSHGITPEIQRDVMTECAELWSKESGISFRLLSSGVGDIEVSYKHMDGMWGQVGIALSPTPFWPKPSTIQLDLYERWKPRKESDNYWYVSMKWAFCHELGHAIGIGHTRIRRAIMFVRAEGQDEQYLHSDDKAAVKALYGESNGKTIEVEWQSKYRRTAPTISPATTHPTTISTTKKRPTTTTTKPTTTTTPTTTSSTSSQTTSNILHISTTLTQNSLDPGSPNRYSLNQFYRDNIRLKNSQSRSVLLSAIQRRRG